MRGPQISIHPDDGIVSDSDSDSSSDDDVEMRDGATLIDEEAIIAVMGVTGAGKSTFISQLTTEDVEVGHNLESCTNEPGVYSYFHDGKKVRLVDTPGFDDTHRSDTEILKDIAFFLSTIYSKKVKLAGIIYLHRITDVRMTGSAFRNLQMLEKLCGENALSKVVLATTMWNLLNLPNSEHNVQVGEDREQQLKEKFWNRFQESGSFITRHMGDAESGRAIVSHMLKNDKPVVLDIQREMVDEGLSLDKTLAGMFLQADQLKMREKYERELAYAQEALDEAMKEKDKESIAILTQQKQDYQSAIAKTTVDKPGLQLNFRSLVEEKDQQYASLAAEMEAEKEARANEIRFIEENLADLQGSLDRQQRDHREELQRVMRSQRAKSAEENQRVAQITERFERQQAEMLNMIAVAEEERQIAEEKRRRKAANSMRNFLTLGLWNVLSGDGEEHMESRRPLRRGHMIEYRDEHPRQRGHRY